MRHIFAIDVHDMGFFVAQSPDVVLGRWRTLEAQFMAYRGAAIRRPRLARFLPDTSAAAHSNVRLLEVACT
ncbi:MAG: hypothetical protein C0511_06655 [Hyphomicrobium sp.]|nr:hypothetical protein [Hyphomicrobium sp.]PPC82545.1 MAG: hypothetical protein CTY40_04540 [Hyphomicrobium sp.]